MHVSIVVCYSQVEYDLASSSEDDLKVVGMDRIEQTAVPTAAVWYPPLSKESFIITANDQVGICQLLLI